MRVDRVFVRGDTHGNFKWLPKWCEDNYTTTNDILIILGDAGINYHLNYNDHYLKERISKCPITIMSIQGNHEKRPEPSMGYKIIDIQDGDNINGSYWIEEQYPNILFMRNGLHIIKGKTFLVADGAYSVDKEYRLLMGRKWFSDEQMTKDDEDVLLEIACLVDYRVDFVLSHTAPLNYEPKYLFLPMIDQSKVDKHTEWLLQEIMDRLRYGFGHWFFGHYHDDNMEISIDPKISILYNEIVRII